MIATLTAGTAHTTDNGLLERLERQGDHETSLVEMLALVDRTADLIERDSYLADELPDERDEAFNAMDTLRARIRDEIWNNETGQTALIEKEAAIRNYHDERREA